MRILIDTNILFSALLFPKSKPAYALLYAANNHQIVLTDRNIFELREIIKRKKPTLLSAAEIFLAQLSFELIPAVEDTAKTIRDVKDQPILNGAIIADVDIILTGDKDFLSLNLDRPKCMTAAEFLENEGATA
ncbi:MAG: putative toxin-antitoxin system toxin component, PIN family [Clostridia bacterium]|nr:putative toxin-antitoxin system toxin component, PIN family [Clostridia bacterium]